MTSSTFDSLRAQLAADREQIVLQKRPEYTEGNADVLNNFKVLAAEIGVTPIQVWYVYFRKHVASIGQFAASPTRTMSEPIVGRIADAMNYLDLLNALIKEEDQVAPSKLHGPKCLNCNATLIESPESVERWTCFNCNQQFTTIYLMEMEKQKVQTFSGEQAAMKVDSRPPLPEGSFYGN